jgi:hypothetical protein
VGGTHAPNEAGVVLHGRRGVSVLGGGGAVEAGEQPSRGAAGLRVFQEQVEAVFLKKREGHTRSVACHTVNNVMTMHLVPLSPGATTWNEEQSRQNFQWVQRAVVPGHEDSLLIKHPLAEAAGGDPRHGGGQQFASKNDPDWQTLKAWVMGAK